MTPFLKQVAQHYFALGDISSDCFIFPNRRAMAFFKKYLAAEVRESGVPAVAPQMFPVNDFFSRITGKRASDRVNLLLSLYDRYKDLNPKAEPLDDFIFWGDVLLSDFDDVDKYLVDPEKLFTNVADFKGMQDTFSYLSPEQREAIEAFLSHFGTAGEIKKEFARIWDLLLPLYRSFRNSLAADGQAYEGQIYRDLAERFGNEPAVDILSPVFPDTKRFIFVGLNALNECEKKVMARMRDARLAEFCWDYTGSMISDPLNKSSYFLKDNVMAFPQAFKPDTDIEAGYCPEISVISVPSSIGQAKQLPGLFAQAAPGGDLSAIGIDTAVVIPDETLLLPVLNSIPSEISRLNVTMGYPMQASGIWSFMNDLAALQLHLRCKDGKWYFYHKQVWAIFSSSIFKTIAGEAGLDRAASIKKGAKYYIPQEDLSGDPLFELLFKPVVTDAAAPSAEAVRAIQDYQQDVLSGIASRIKGDPDMAVELDFAREIHLAVGRLKNHVLPILPATYFRLLAKLAGGLSVPFQGEPLEGLQIMGPLETRALDFDNLVILSCNEGMFPRRSVSSSFIPPELRKGFGLPTYEFQDAVWAYYFYRMIRRARRVTMLYDSRTEVSRSGEESRYIRQLEMHFGIDIKRYVVKAPIAKGDMEGDIEKTADDLVALHAKPLSASALQRYLSCPAKFYFSNVKRLKADDEVSESLDAGMVGNVFHKTMELLYKGRREISADYIKGLLKDGKTVRDTVRGRIMEELHTFEVSGRNIIFEDMVCMYVNQTLRRDLQLLEQYGTSSFRILGLEEKCEGKIGGFDFVGYIDRLDSFEDGTVRVVDYKTGKVTDNDFIINEDNAASVVDALFGDDNAKRPKIALQLYLYDRFAKDKECCKGKEIVNTIYQTSRLFVKDIEHVALNGSFCGMMEERVDTLLAEISDLSVPWSRKRDEKGCSYCDFKNICGQ